MIIGLDWFAVNGWVKYTGEGMPVDGAVIVDAVLEDGYICSSIIAEGLCWDWDAAGSIRVVGYRVNRNNNFGLLGPKHYPPMPVCNPPKSDIGDVMSRWVEYDGSGFPWGQTIMVDVKCRDGNEINYCPSDYFDWRWHTGSSNSEITAYRICENQPMLPETKSPKGIGDVASNEKGAGARYNAGKAPLELIPLRLIVEERRRFFGNSYAVELDALESLAAFQEGGDVNNLIDAIQAIGSQWDECAAVFEYGKRKYAEWNWAKGMPWCVPIACAARHILYGIMEGEENDKESGLPHRGHFICNIVMLWTYAHTYKEGDDRPKKWLSGLYKDVYQELESTQ